MQGWITLQKRATNLLLNWPRCADIIPWKAIFMASEVPYMSENQLKQFHRATANRTLHLSPL